MVFAYCLHVEVDIEAQTDTTFFPGAAALKETHGANGDLQPPTPADHGPRTPTLKFTNTG